MGPNVSALRASRAERPAMSECFPDQDSLLAQRALTGDQQAFSALVDKFHRPIYSYALHFFRDPERAQDAVQDTFLKAYRFLGTYDPKRRFGTWLYAIARNLCIDGHRDTVRRNQVALETVSPGALERTSEKGDPLSLLERREEQARLLNAIHELPEKYRTPIVLCYLEDLSYQDISEIVGISLNNTKIRIFRAKKMILEILGRLEAAR